VMKYAHESDVRLVLLGLLLVWCLLAYAFQAHNHERTVKLIRAAAENNLGITQGGNATVSARRLSHNVSVDRKLENCAVHCCSD
jgi:hypothetical protein